VKVQAQSSDTLQHKAPKLVLKCLLCSYTYSKNEL